MPLENHQAIASLWTLYTENNFERLNQVGWQLKENYPFLPEVVKAHEQRQSKESFKERPLASLIRIQNDLNTREFEPVFQEFCKSEPIYGFGDLRVKRLLKQINAG